MNAPEILRRAEAVRPEKYLNVRINCPTFDDRDDLIIIAGAITTVHKYEDDYWSDSLGHLYSDGSVMCYEAQVATDADIEVIGEIPAGDVAL